jgi:hypothetical protein
MSENISLLSVLRWLPFIFLFACSSHYGTGISVTFNARLELEYQR